MQKSFFRRRTVPQIRKLSVKRVYHQRDLAERIDALDPNSDALEIRVQILPGRFYQRINTSKDASRTALKRSETHIMLSHPETKEQCRDSSLIPLQIRTGDLRVLEEMKEKDINYTGIAVRPNWGDKIKRFMPFWAMAEGERIFAYAEQHAGGIKVEPYADSLRVWSGGANVVVEVPSRTEKQGRYRFRIMHVPMQRNPENLATVLSLKPATVIDEETGEPNVGRTAHDDTFFRYTKKGEAEDSPIITTYPHDVAGYIKIFISELEENHNMTPMEMNPYVLFSKRGAEFYHKLRNNVIIADHRLKSKDKLRQLNIGEQSILLARDIGRFGHDVIAYWEPGRDGMIRDYDWSVSGRTE